MIGDGWAPATLSATRGGYESYFVHAHHPSRPLALWLRATRVLPRGEPGFVERWLVLFDGERRSQVVVREPRALDADLRSLGQFDASGAVGEAADHAHRVAWRLAFSEAAPASSLLSERLLRGPWPRAKLCSPAPRVIVSGELVVDAKRLVLEGWRGAIGHNWGSRHTDRYTWVQCANFEGAPEAYFEAATAQLNVAGLWTPAFTPLVLQHQGRRYAVNSLRAAVRPASSAGWMTWRARAETEAWRLDMSCQAPRIDTVRLRYVDPPGGVRRCLNSKLATLVIRIEDRGSGRVEVLRAHRKAALEQLV